MTREKVSSNRAITTLGDTVLRRVRIQCPVRLSKIRGSPRGPRIGRMGPSSGERNRTSIHSFRDCCPTIRRRLNIRELLEH